MDKPGFVYSVNGLRAAGWAGKALYPSCTERGQKRIGQQKSGFCTCDAVDMNAFFHRRAGVPQFWLLELPVCRPGSWRTVPLSGLQFSIVRQQGRFFLPRSWHPTFFLKTKNACAALAFARAGFASPDDVRQCRGWVFHAQPFTVFS